MSEHLSSMQAEIVGKDKGAVEALLGRPLRVGYWHNTHPPKDADAAAVEAFRAAMLDEIWIYTNGRVHFSLAGKALEVDNDVSKDLPPEENPPLFA